jgi:Tol biopolymer transport system component
MAELNMKCKPQKCNNRPVAVRGVAAMVAAICVLASLTVYTDNPLSRAASAINTIGYEDSPFLSADGTHIYFMYTPYTMWPVFFGKSPVLVGPERYGHHINTRNPWEDSDIYVTRLEDGAWSTPQNLGLNDDQADCCVMTWDHRRFVYQRTQRPNGALTDVYFMQLLDDGRWVRSSAGKLVNLASTSESNPHISADGRMLYFSSDRPGGFGKMDLYVSSRRNSDGTWQMPQNLGAAFNTRENEDQIWVSRDGRTIFFNREPGPHILQSTWSKGSWSVPEPVLFGGRTVIGAEASLDDDQQRMMFAEVRPDLEDIVFVFSDRQPDGSWSAVRPILSTPQD